MGGQRLLCVLEVLGLDVRRPGFTVAERLDQDVLRGIVQAPGPVEPQAARLGAGGPRELTGDLGPAAGVFRPDSELGGDEDHRGSFSEVELNDLAPATAHPGLTPDARPLLLHATLHRADAACRGGWLSGRSGSVGG